MQLKKLVTYKIPFRSKSVLWCGIFFALSIFLRCFYYFIPCDFTKVSVGNWIFTIVLPLLLCIAFATLVRIVHLRAPGIYGILAAVLCLALFIGDVLEGNLSQIILSVCTMPFLSLLLLATFGGYIPYRSISGCALMLVSLLRFLFWLFSATAWSAMLADVTILLGLFSFTLSLNPFED